MNIYKVDSSDWLKTSKSLIQNVKNKNCWREALPKDITKLAQDCITIQQPPTTPLLLNLRKIAKKISNHKAEGRWIWEGLDQVTKKLLSALYPQNYYQSISAGFESLSFEDGSIYHLKRLKQLGDVQLFQIEGKNKKIFAHFPLTPMPIDYREGLGIKYLETNETSEKGRWVILPAGSKPYKKLSFRGKAPTTQDKKIAENILRILFLEKEFGIPLYHEEKLFQVLDGEVYPLHLADCPLSFISDVQTRHEAFISPLPVAFRTLFQDLYLYSSFFENVKKLFTENILKKEGLNDQNSQTCKVVLMLWHLDKQISLPWQLFSHNNILFFTYLLAYKTPLSHQAELYDLAKTLIQIIPRRGRSCNHSEFIEKERNICLQLRGKLLSLVMNHFKQTGSLNLEIISNHLLVIGASLEKDPELDSNLQPIKDLEEAPASSKVERKNFYDPFPTISQYFHSIFSKEFMEDLESLSSGSFTKALEFDLLPLCQNPKGKLILLRLYHDLIAPVEEEKIREILKPLYKQAKHEKLGQKLKRRLEKFKEKELQ